MAAMPLKFRTLVLLLLVAMMPVRAVAGVAMAFCATGHQEMPAAHGGHATAAVGEHAAHVSGDAPAQPDPQRCSICTEHCSSAAFATADARVIAGVAIEEDVLPGAERCALAFFPDQLDRPPLASLR
jgi:hypothetical protein